MKTNSILRIAAATILALAAFGADAATATANIAVSAQVGNNCVIDVTPLAFGAYDSMASTALTSNSTVTVTCTMGASTSINLSRGTNAGSTSTPAIPQRRMVSGANYLLYTLMQADGTSVWAETIATAVLHTGTGLPVAYTAAGSIAPGQLLPAGSYSDSVVATINF